jgi:hypothetical protein
MVDQSRYWEVPALCGERCQGAKAELGGAFIGIFIRRAFRFDKK